MTWPWVWLRRRRKLFLDAENALRRELQITSVNVGRAREVTRQVKAATAAQEAGGTIGG